MATNSFLRVRDLDVCVEVHGSGPRVLLISGTGADLRADPNRANHPLVQAGFTVAMYDQRGLGRTTKPDSEYSMAMYADDAAGLLDALAWPTAHVMGISFGGMVAQHVVLRHSDRVNRLVLACTSSGGAGGSSFDLLAIHDLDPVERQKIALSVMDTRNDMAVDPPVFAPGLEPIVRGMAAMALLDADDPSKAMGARRQLEARAPHDVWTELPSVRARTLVVGGRFDQQASPENVANLASRISGAQLTMFDGGHLFLVQDPNAWPTIASFLQQE
jgi:3-oxoadipate enol-lactonase